MQTDNCLKIPITLLCFGFLIHFGIALNVLSADTSPAAAENEKASVKRVGLGLQVLYDFSSGSGPIVEDVSRMGQSVNLRIEDMKSVKWSQNGLRIERPTILVAQGQTDRLTNSIIKTNELTIEAWITPAKINQSGPARILTFSENSSERNFTIGQDDKKFDVRLRTSKTSTNGLPSVSSKNVANAKLTHVVYTKDRSGKARFFINGRPNQEGKVAGQIRNWRNSFKLALANENGGGRPWLGTFHLAAIYNRALTAKEVALNFRAGHSATTFADESLAVDPKAHFFETKIAPLLAHHCLECHDSATNEGGLDLSRKVAALKGGDSGAALVAGHLDKSVLWERVVSDEMPENRDPLNAEEKELLKKWINSGATFSVDFIDPVIYEHGSQERQNWVQRLTVSEYIASVKTATGVDISTEARDLLPKDYRADGFSNTAYNLTVDLGHVEAYAELAEAIVDKMDVVKFADRFAENHKLIDDNMRDFIAKMGRWVLRGPLTEEEVVVYRGISTTVASAGGNFRDASAYILEAMLQSPRFIYRIENQRGDGEHWPVNEFELANRMSYILWGAPPDRELVNRAESGELLTREELKNQIDRMLADPKAVERSKEFIAEWLNLNRLQNLQPDADRFPKWNDQLAADMKAETLTYYEEVVWNQKRPLADLLNAQVTFLTPELAKHYGMKPQGKGLQKYDVSAVPGRGGLLTQGSILTIGGDNASMVTRGLFVLHDLLRGIVKDPPPCVDTTPIPTKAGISQRSIALDRISNQACGGCHSRFEPLAFGLEKFDGLGTYHDVDEHGNELRDDGEVLIPGEAKPIKFSSSAELMNLLAESPRVQESLTWKVTQFAMGRPLTAEDAKSVQQIHEAAMKQGGTYQDLVREIILSDLVQYTKTEVVDVDQN